MSIENTGAQENLCSACKELLNLYFRFLFVICSLFWDFLVYPPVCYTKNVDLLAF